MIPQGEAALFLPGVYKLQTHLIAGSQSMSVGFGAENIP